MKKFITYLLIMTINLFTINIESHHNYVTYIPSNPDSIIICFNGNTNDGYFPSIPGEYITKSHDTQESVVYDIARQNPNSIVITTNSSIFNKKNYAAIKSIVQTYNPTISQLIISGWSSGGYGAIETTYQLLNDFSDL